MLCLYCLYIAVPWPWLGLALLCYCAWVTRVVMRLCGSHRLLFLRVDVYGQMTLAMQSGGIRQVVLLPDSVVHRWLMVLHVRDLPFMHDTLGEDSHREDSLGKIKAVPANSHTRLVLLPDQVSAQAWRKLRVWLHWGYPQQP